MYLLQLRFQQNGISYVESMVRPIEDLARRYGFSSSASASSSSLAAAAAAAAASNFSSASSYPAPSAVDALSIEPRIAFKIGQVVHHKKFRYRGVIAGFDQRPLGDVSSWEAIAGSAFGQNQPFYNVIPDENDVERRFG